MPENIEAGEIQENVFAVKINVSYPGERAVGRALASDGRSRRM